MVDGSEILHQLIGSLSHYPHGFIHPRWLALGCVEPSTAATVVLRRSLPSQKLPLPKCARQQVFGREGSGPDTNWVPQSWAICHLVFQNPHVVTQRGFCCAGTVVLDVDAPSSASALGCLEQWCLFGVQLFYVDGVQWIYRIYWLAMYLWMLQIASQTLQLWNVLVEWQRPCHISLQKDLNPSFIIHQLLLVKWLN